MVSKFSMFLQSAAMKAHAGLGHVIRSAKIAVPHIRRGLSTIGMVAKYVKQSGLHPGLSIGAAAIEKASKLGGQLIDRYEPTLNKVADAYGNFSLPPVLRIDGVSQDRTMPLVR